MTTSERTEATIEIGSLIFDGIDQIDLTGPFEVLSRVPGARHRFYGLSTQPVRDVMGMRLVPDATIEETPVLTVLHVPGGVGQEALMEDGRVLDWLRTHSAAAGHVLSVCTGALLLGAAGLLRGRRATTHWAAFDLLRHFGAEPVDERVVRDGKWTFAAGVTAGIDGALTLAADLAGADAAQRIQLDIAYAPQPPFDSGTPASAPPAVLERSRRAGASLHARREATARRIAETLGVATEEAR